MDTKYFDKQNIRLKAESVNEKEKAVTAKTVPRDIRGGTQSQRQLRTAENETVRSVTTQAQMHTRTRQVQLAIQKAASNTRRTVTAVSAWVA